MNFKTIIMKYLNKINVLSSFLTLCLFASCNQDQEGPEYAGEGVAFSSSTLASVVVSPNDPTYTVDIFRADASTAQTGSVSITAVLADKNKTPLDGCTVSDYSFAAGEEMTTVTVNVEPLAIGIELNVTLKIADTNIAVGGTGAASMVVSKDYNWQLLGKGTYTDNWSSGVTYDVDIYKAEDFDRYRVMDPYTESLKNDDGDWGDWISLGTVCPHVTFWTVTDGTVSFSPFSMGLNYEANNSQPIYAYPPTAFAGLSSAFNKWIDAKTIQLAPYYYIDGVGGWNNTAANGVIIITLP